MTLLGDADVQSWEVTPFQYGGVPLASVEFTVDVFTQGPLDLEALMDAILAKLPASWKRTFAWPSDKITPPCVVIGYPTGATQFDMTFGEGSDNVKIPVYFVCGKWVERATRHLISTVLSGAAGIKGAVDGALEA